uniref:Uncharacterized protein n=1 Tax=Panagrolaimus superbus TaxID=310955 RepID=A0A914XVU8_9BILA
MSKPRRLSVDHWQSSLVTRIDNAKDLLSGLWDEMALSEEQRKERLQDSEKLVFDLLDNMVKYEQQQLEEVKRKCLQYRKELEELRHELGIGPISETMIPKGLAPSGNWLKNECKALIKKKKERMSEQLQVYQEVKEACDRIGWDLVTGDNISTHLVPTSRIMEWKKQKIEADTVYIDRIDKIKQLQSAIRGIVNHIGRKEFDDHDITLVDMDYDKYKAVLSEEIVQSFENLHTRANQSYTQWYENIQFEYDELMIELQELWEVCIVAECDRFFPKTFNPEIQTVDDIENLRNEIAQLRLKYTEGKIVYDKLREWLALWHEKLEYEDDSKNSKDKYNNRGGSLQARLKREAQLRNQVPRVLSELEALCEEFGKTHENIPTAGPGRMHAAEYARWLVQSYEDEKRIDKETKDDQKRVQLAQESRFGVSPSPVKSTSHRPKTTPSIHRTITTPASIRKTPRKPLFGLNSSKSLQDGPKTSSPKDLIYLSPRRIPFSPALSSIPSSPLSAQRQQPPKSPSRPWRY